MVSMAVRRAILANCAPSGEMHNYCTPHIIKENFENFLIHQCNYILLSQVYWVWQVVKTPTIIYNNPVYWNIYRMHGPINAKFINTKQANETYQYKNIKRKLYKTNAAIWYNKICRGVTNTRCYRYSCMRSWWWVEVPPETCRAVSRYK